MTRPVRKTILGVKRPGYEYLYRCNSFAPNRLQPFGERGQTRIYRYSQGEPSSTDFICLCKMIRPVMLCSGRDPTGFGS